VYVLLILLACVGQEVLEAPGAGLSEGQRGSLALVLADSADDAVTTYEAPAGEVVVSGGARAQVDPVICAVTGVEADEVTYAWSVDGEAFTGLTMTVAAAGDGVFPGYTHAGQVWTCTAHAWSGGVEVASGSAETPIGAAPALTELDPLLPPDAWLEGTTKLHYRGPLAASGTLKVTWGVNGWATRSAAPGASTGQYSTAPFYAYVVTPMQAEGGEWVADVQLPDSAREVSMVFSDGVSTDDASGHQYTWDLEFPSVGPYLTWNDAAPPTNGMVINWATGQPGYGVVEYGPDADHLAYAIGPTVDTLHHVALTGLPDGQTFVYRVLDASGRASAWSTFRTAALEEDTYSFLVAADMQDMGSFNDRWADVAEEMSTSTPDARFVLAPGDLPADDQPGLWWIFFDSGRELFNHVPLVPSLGNHDTPGVESSSDSSSWQYWFDLPATPGSETYWRLDYGRTRVFTVNSEIPSQMSAGKEQYGWMEAESLDLIDGDARAADWAMAAFHIPAYDAGGRFAVNATQLRPFTELFDGAVDAVISGHEHIYQRFEPLQYPGVPAPSGEYGLGPDDGVLYLVTPAAGFSDLYTNLVGAKDPGGDQLGMLAWPEVSDEGDGTSDKDEEEDFEEHVSPNGSGDGPNVAPIQGYLLGEVTPDTLTFSFIGMGNSLEAEPAEVQDTVTVRH